MAENTSKVDILDFIISVLINHQKELEKDINRLEQIAKKLEQDVSKHLHR